MVRLIIRQTKSLSIASRGMAIPKRVILEITARSRLWFEHLHLAVKSQTRIYYM